MNPTFRLAAAAFAATAPALAQTLALDARGGSMPGTITLEAAPASFPFEPGVLLFALTPGPTPISLYDPFDPRDLAIGSDLLSAYVLFYFGFDLDLQVSFPAPVSPSFVDQPIYFQVATLTYSTPILGQLSNGNVVRLGNAGSFRDRGVSFQNDRAFATVLPRPDRTLLLVGGARGQLLAQVATSSTQIYDPMADAFTPGPTLNAPRSLHTSTQLPDGTWLIAGGVNANNDPQATCELYDPVTDTFTPIVSMGTPRTGHTATLLANGKVLVTGGIQAMPVTPTQLQPIRETIATTELYDPSTGLWSAGPSMATPRVGHAAMVRPDGKVLLAGGISWDPNLVFSWVPAVRRSCDLYDPVANTMASAPQMAFARSLIDPVELGNGKFLVAGGINGITILPFNPGNPTNTAEVYDAIANTWTTVGSMATARGNHRAFPLGNGQFLLAGGANGSILSPNALSSTEVFSTATNLFTPGPAMANARAGAAAFPIPQGQMMFFGGGSTGGSITNTTEWYYF